MKHMVEPDGTPWWRISYSEFSCWNQCPQKWNLSYNKGYWPTHSAKPLVQGAAFHHGIEKFLLANHGKEPKTLHKKAAQIVGYGHFKKYIEGRKNQFYPDERAQALREMSYFLPMYQGLQNFLCAYVPVIQGDIEQSKNMRLKGDYGSMAKGDYIERLKICDEHGTEFRLMGLDWKGTGQEKHKMPADYQFQGEVYCTIYGLLWFAVVNFVKRSMAYNFLPMTVGEEQKQLVRDKVEMFGQQMRSGLCPPLGVLNNSGFGRCFNCNYWRGKSRNVKDLGLEKTCKYGVK